MERTLLAIAGRTLSRFRPWRTLGILPILLLSACGAFTKEPPRPCPAVFPVTDARTLTRFIGDGRDLTDVIFEARIEDAGLICEYDDEIVEAEMRVSIMVVDGPADREGIAKLAYFVAIATGERKILAREEFALEVPFEGNRTRMIAVEEISPRIPLRSGEDGEDYVIFVGLALTPDELQYNRENR